jgi:SNF2 family DNA or RNA helicase
LFTNSCSSSNDDDYVSEPGTPSRKKKKLFEDASARDLREQDKERQAAQEMRRKQLRERLAQFGSLGNVDLYRHIINEGKFDDQGYIYVEEEIGKRIKPHQLEGVRFIWNQITADGKATQGCLLAHTMGLGKTMQA